MLAQPTIPDQNKFLFGRKLDLPCESVGFVSDVKKTEAIRVRECLMGLGNIVRYQIVTEDGDKIKFRHSPAQSMDNSDTAWLNICELVAKFEHSPFVFEEFSEFCCEFYLDADITEPRYQDIDMIFAILENEGVITASSQGLRFFEVSDNYNVGKTSCPCESCSDYR